MSARFQLDVGDCVDWLRGIADESVHLVVTDPAYESLEKHRAKGTTTRLAQSDGSSNEWFPIFPNERFAELLAELYRVLVANAHVYLICDDETSDVLKPLCVAAGFTWWKRLVWVKTDAAGNPRMGMGYHYRASHEFVCFIEKGKRRLASLSVLDTLFAPVVVGAYPTEKPLKLLRTLVEQSSSPGELVIDPFTGSGSAGEASLDLGRDFAGVDVKPETPALSRLSRCGERATVLRPRAQGRLFG